MFERSFCQKNFILAFREREEARQRIKAHMQTGRQNKQHTNNWW